jgi:hypothetical protein
MGLDSNFNFRDNLKLNVYYAVIYENKRKQFKDIPYIVDVYVNNNLNYYVHRSLAC